MAIEKRFAEPKTAEDVVELHQYLLTKVEKATDLFEEKVGEVAWDFAQNDDVSTRDIGEILVSALLRLQTPDEYKAAESVLVALLGEGIFEILDTVEERDKEGYSWYCVEERGC